MRGLWLADGAYFSRCPRCGLIQQNPQPESSAVQARYGADYLDYEIKNESAFVSLGMKALADVGLRTDGAPLRGARFLDVGCAIGALVAGLRAGGVEASGLDVCREAAEYARSVRSLPVFSGTLEEAAYPTGSFDFVHASHVIEHLNDPAGFLAEIGRVLKPDGRLVLVTPNADGFQARVAGSAWRSAINDHLYLFSRRTLGGLLAGAGFRALRWKTWGGWAQGMKPAFLKPFLDPLAKSLGWGDVMVVLAAKPGSPSA
jgi:2-polyprenyl-3-methyl-5-hydroxy-6-metoxy-1,4-benzoquinol methylase